MNHSNGWIKLYRDLAAWEWWDDPVMVKAFVAILILCSSEQTSWHGTQLRAGEFVTSINHLAVLLNVSIKKVRTILNRLQRTGEITVKTTNRCSIICVTNWNLYQNDDASETEKETKKGNLQAIETKQDELDLFDDAANEGQAEDNQDQADQKPEKPSVFPFDAFWEMYGKKTDRKKCEVAYARIKEQERAKIKEHLPRYVEATPNKMYRKNPLTYLHGACWNDEIQKQQQDRNGVLHGYGFSENESGTGKQDWEP